MSRAGDSPTQAHTRTDVSGNGHRRKPQQLAPLAGADERGPETQARNHSGSVDVLRTGFDSLGTANDAIAGRRHEQGETDAVQRSDPLPQLARTKATNKPRGIEDVVRRRQRSEHPLP